MLSHLMGDRAMRAVYVVLIIIFAAAVIAFGYFLMNRLDCFLEENKRRISAGKGREPSGGLRIAFENPVIAHAVSRSLEALSEKHPDEPLYFFTGSAEQIHNALKTNCIDLGLVISETADDAAIPLGRNGYYSGALGGSVELLEKCGRYFRIFRRDNELSQEKRKLLTELVGSIEADKGR